MKINLSATQKGLITAVIMVLTAILLFYRFDLPINGSNQNILLCIYIAGIIWTLWYFKKTAPPGTKFGKYFSEGFKCFIVVTLFTTVYLFIFIKFNPQLLDAEMLRNNALIIQQGDRTLAEIKDNEQKIRDIYIPMMLGINIFKYLILGAMVTAVSGAFMSQKK